MQKLDVLKCIKQTFLPTEPNCSAATIIFIASCMLDSFTALDPLGTAEFPSSLRTTAMIIIGVLGAPPIVDDNVFLQRAVVGVGLVLVSLLGLHANGPGSRLGDAIFIFLVLFGSVISEALGGVESAISSKSGRTVSKTAKAHVFRDSSCACACAIMAYSALRVTRVGLFHAELQRYDDVFSLSSTSSSVALTLGGGVATATAAILFFSHELRQNGTSAKKTILVIAFFMLIFASLFASLAAGEQIAHLSAIFSESSCPNDDACPMARFARRRAIVATTASPLWVLTLGVAVLSFAPDARVKTWKDEAGVDAAVATSGAICAMLCILLVAVYCDFSSAGAEVEVCFVVAVIGISLTAFTSYAVGNTIFVVSLVTAEVFTLTNTHFITLLTHPTHCTVLVLVLALLARSLLEFATSFYTLFTQFVVDLMDEAVGILSVFATSVSVFLFFGSAILESTYTGNLLELPSYGAFRAALEFVLLHYAPTLTCLPIFSRSAAVSTLPTKWRVGVWVLSPFLPLIIWIAALLISQKNADHTIQFNDSNFLFGVLSCVVVPWLSVSFL